MISGIGNRRCSESQFSPARTAHTESWHTTTAALDIHFCQIIFRFETASGGLGLEPFLDLLPAVYSHLDRCKPAVSYRVYRIPPVLVETIMCAGPVSRDKR